MAPSSDVTPPPFDVVSIREAPPVGTSFTIRIGNTPSGYEVTNFSLKDIISQAYGIRADLISGLPDWASTIRYNITAKVAEADAPTLKKLSPTQRAAMLIPVLADRFQLKAHKDSRIQPTYDLLVDKGGPRLKPGTPLQMPSAPPTGGPIVLGNRVMMGPGQITVPNQSISMLVSQLASRTHRPVVDKTGLTGRYDIDLKWTPEQQTATGASDNGAADDQPGSIFTALREQLGLKLVSSKGPVDTLVIDHVEKPSQN